MLKNKQILNKSERNKFLPVDDHHRIGLCEYLYVNQTQVNKNFRKELEKH